VPKIPLGPERQKLTPEQELAMVQRSPQEREGAGQPAGSRQQALAEHFARLENHQPLPSFDAPGVFEHGPERSGEGPGTGEGGKYRSIASYGFKHVSYLLGMQRKIELVFTVPQFRPDHGAIGVPVVGFTVRRNGELAETVLLRSSGYPAVDQALLKAVKRAAPYHPFPDDMPDQEISIRIYASLS
jgi:TonB family protein